MPRDRKTEIILITKRESKAEKYTNSKQAYKIFKEMLNYENYELRNKEHFWVMGIDNIGFIVCIYIVALGSGNQVKMTAAEVLDIAVGLKSRKIILAHNHPFETMKPSDSDITMTNMLYHACTPFSIEVLDHIIIAINKYYSFEEHGDMEKIRNDETYKRYAHGYSEGEDKGIKIGKIEGLEQGKYEEKIAMAKNLLKLNLDIKDIIKVTGFTKKEIEKLRDSL